MINLNNNNLKKNYIGQGIRQEQIQNYIQFKKILESFICPICLDIVVSPYECELCQTLYCEECWEFTKTSGKKCTMNCEKLAIKKANKFVLNTLSNLRITCDSCNKTNIPYNIYIIHFKVCGPLKALLNNGEINKQISNKKIQIEEIDKQITELDKNGLKNNSYLKLNQDLSDSLNSNIEYIQNKLLTFNLNLEEKLKLYNNSVEGKLSNFKHLIETCKFPIFEEVSSNGYLWTSLHYAMHYGKEEIIFYILDYCKEKYNNLDLVLNLNSRDGRCPILCLLKSNSINIEKKKHLLKNIIFKYKNIKLSDKAKTELRKSNLLEILENNN